MRRVLPGIVALVVLVGFLYVLVPMLAYSTVPDRDTAAVRFDVLIVLGHPARKDGSPDPEMRERVDESVREYRKGVAPRIVMSGAAAHNRFVEAQVMADLAVSEGVPRAAIVLEPEAKDTIQNIWYSRRIMLQHGWTSAEVISSAYHLPRTALILEHYRDSPLAFSWKTHASAWPAEYGWGRRFLYIFHEALGMVKLRMGGFGHRPFLPAILMTKRVTASAPWSWFT